MMPGAVSRVAIYLTAVAKSAIKTGDTVTTVGVDQVDTGAIDTRAAHAFVDVLKHTMQSGFRRLCRPRDKHRNESVKFSNVEYNHTPCTVITL